MDDGEDIISVARGLDAPRQIHSLVMRPRLHVNLCLKRRTSSLCTD